MNDRQRDFFKKIIELYIETGVPVGSKALIYKYNLKVSSATVRNEMSYLEREGFLEKSHTSSGRIPSLKGYKLFAKKLASNDKLNLEGKLKDIFAKRRASIDFTLEEAAKIVTEIAGLTMVTTNSENNELMKSIQLTPINDKSATIVIVTSAGRVESKIIDINKHINIEDIRISVRLFKERLIDTPLRDLAPKMEALSPILAKSVKNYEKIIQAFVSKVFDFHKHITNKVYGNTNIIKSVDIKREDLAKLIELMEHKSIFESIEGKLDEDEKIKIDIRPDNSSIISTQIEHNNKMTEVSIIGTNRMDYSEAKIVIKLLKEFLGGDK